MSSPSIFSLCLEFQSETCGITVENLSIIFVVLLCGSSPSLSMISSLPSPSLIHSYPTFKLLWVPRAMFRSPSCGSSSMTSSFPSPSLIHSYSTFKLLWVPRAMCSHIKSPTVSWPNITIIILWLYAMSTGFSSFLSHFPRIYSYPTLLWVPRAMFISFLCLKSNAMSNYISFLCLMSNAMSNYISFLCLKSNAMSNYISSYFHIVSTLLVINKSPVGIL